MMILKAGGTEAGWPCGSSLHRLKKRSVYEAEFVNCYQTVLVFLQATQCCSPGLGLGGPLQSINSTELTKY